MQKITFVPHLFLEILQRHYKLAILGTLCTPVHTHQKQYHELVGISDIYLQAKNQLNPSKKNFFFFLHKYDTFKNPGIWLTKNILGNNSRTRILPDMGLRLRVKNQKKLLFCIVFMERKKWQKYPIFGPFCPNLEKNKFFNKNRINYGTRLKIKTKIKTVS